MKGIFLRFSNAGWDFLQDERCGLKNKTRTAVTRTLKLDAAMQSRP